MRTFEVERRNDETGVSGTGVVVEGVEFSNGVVVIRWTPSLGSIAIYNCFADFVAIHVNSHPTNRTVITFSDGEVFEQ